MDTKPNRTGPPSLRLVVDNTRSQSRADTATADTSMGCGDYVTHWWVESRRGSPTLSCFDCGATVARSEAIENGWYWNAEASP